MKKYILAIFIYVLLLGVANGMGDSCGKLYGDYSQFNIKTNKCECIENFELTEKTIGVGYECINCISKYGFYSSYNNALGNCECDSGYFLSDGRCEKQETDGYFYLSEFDEENYQIIISSYYTNVNYLVKLGFKSNLDEVNNFVGQLIKIHLGTNYIIDSNDEIILENKLLRKEINLKILFVEKVSDNYTFYGCEDGTLDKNNNCICNKGYSYNTSLKKCEKSSNTYNVEYNYSNDNNTGSNSNNTSDNNENNLANEDNTDSYNNLIIYNKIYNNLGIEDNANKIYSLIEIKLNDISELEKFQKYTNIVSSLNELKDSENKNDIDDVEYFNQVITNIILLINNDKNNLVKTRITDIKAQIQFNKSIDKAFEKFQKLNSNLSEIKLKKKYNELLVYLEKYKLKITNERKIKMIDRFIYLINNELDISSQCDEIGEFLGICKIK